MSPRRATFANVGRDGVESGRATGSRQAKGTVHVTIRSVTTPSPAGAIFRSRSERFALKGWSFVFRIHKRANLYAALAICI
jgi:hypothetical protein